MTCEWHGTSRYLPLVGETVTPQAVRLIEWEAQLRAPLGESANVVAVYDLGSLEGHPFVVNQFMAHGSLAKHMSEGEMSADTLARLVRELCGALDAVHARGIVHGDVCPDNIWLDEGDVPHLGDFEFATEIGRDTLGAASLITTSGAPYAAPEALEGDTPSMSWDLYSLGVVLYQGITGKLPFPEGVDSLEAKRRGDYQLPTTVRSDLSPAFDAIVGKLFDPDAANRYQSAAELRQALVSTEQLTYAAVQALIARGESELVEFKSSFRYPHGTELAEDALRRAAPQQEKQAGKAIAAFRNTKNGGKLLLGVADDGVILGIEKDYETLSSRRTEDGWRLPSRRPWATTLAPEIGAELVPAIVECDGRHVAVVRVELRGDDGTWMKDGAEFRFYIRSGPSSVPLSPPDACRYVRQTFFSE